MSTQQSTVAATGDEALLTLAKRFASVYASYKGAEEVFAPDAVFDVNVPMWRFQVQGPEAFLCWLTEHSPEGYDIRPLQVIPTTSGFVLELEGTYSPRGQVLYFRNLLLCEVREGRVTDVVFYCTGDWDARTRARQTAEAPMVNR